MCGFIVTNKKIENLEEVNFFNQKRGPDATTVNVYGDITVVHNLLHLTGQKVEQPFVKDDCICVFNGEIYNYKDFGDYKTDGECIIDAYKEYGKNFSHRFDGEFSIVIIDFKNSNICFERDMFNTKPMWGYINVNEDYMISSYKSCLQRLGLKSFFNIPNSYLPFKNFDLDQHKNTYDDWIIAFERAIEKRTRNAQHGIFMGLSSGYDSGAISCELNKQKVGYKPYSVRANEDLKTLLLRFNTNSEMINLSRKEYRSVKKWLKINCEDFEYTDKFGTYNIKQDKASIGLGAICARARDEGRRIYLSGQGADEIMSDYGWNGKKFYSHSEFGGKFPDNLEGFFPWHSFYDGTQIKYLNKEEYVAGAYGIETRYPFLDKDLVQEFLWLTPELKNKNYKAPLHEYFERNGYPFNPGIKIGFRAKDNLC